MKAIFKYLKKFVPWITAVILFVIIQTTCELQLPQYTSNIVNIGIQQGGITDTIPEKIRASELEKIFMLVSPEEEQQIKSAYVLEGEIYELLSIEQAERDALSDIMLKPLALLFYIEQGEGNGSGTDTDNDNNTDFSALIGETQELQQLLEEGRQGDEETAQDSLNEALLILDNLDESILSQSVIAYIQQEYAACGEDLDAIRLDYMYKTAGQMLVIALIIALSAIGANFSSSRFGAGFSRALRSAVFSKVMHFSQKEFADMPTATLITRTTNDIQQIQMLISMSLRLLFFAPIMGFGSLFKVINMNAGMSWVVGCAVGAVLIMMLLLLIITMPKFKVLQNFIDKINQVAREALSGLAVVRAFSREEYENQRFDKANRDLTGVSLFVNRMMSVLMPGMSLIMNGVCILIIWVGADLVNNGSAQVGDLLAFIQYAMHIVMSFMFLSMISIQLPRALVSMKRVGEILEMPISITDPQEPAHFSGENSGVVEFKNVSFRYPNAEADVLHDISFKALPGQTTAFIGSTGSGKSTLINLVPRFFDISEGQILIDSVDIRKVPLSELRAKIGFVPQKAILFSGTIASNIAYGDENVSEEEIKKAAEIAQAADFIEADARGYEREISQGGTNVSGGQRQRLSIARAIAKNPDIYIFDDSFSALDFKTDAALRRALSQNITHATVLIVAQRISTVLNAEQIIVLDKGKIVGKGRHEELLHNCPVYRQIAESQLSKEELNI